MNKTFVLGLIAVVVGGGALLLYLVFSAGDSTTTKPIGGGFVTTPNVTNVPIDSTTPGQQASTTPAQGVMGADGSFIQTKNFKQEAESSPNIPQHYFISGGLDPGTAQASYSIYYTESDQSFNITLLKTPIKDFRKLAENELREQLGVSENDMCRLRYWVGVPFSVNQEYSGKNLGFSFCPGATQL